MPRWACTRLHEVHFVELHCLGYVTQFKRGARGCSVNAFVHCDVAILSDSVTDRNAPRRVATIDARLWFESMTLLSTLIYNLHVSFLRINYKRYHRHQHREHLHLFFYRSVLSVDTQTMAACTSVVYIGQLHCCLAEQSQQIFIITVHI